MLRPPGGGPGSRPNANGYIYAGSSNGLSHFELDRIEIWQYVVRVSYRVLELLFNLFHVRIH